MVYEEQCTTVWSLDVTGANRVVIEVSFAVVAVVTLLLNSMMIYALIKTNQAGLLAARFMIAMCVSDLGLAIFFDCTMFFIMVLRVRVCFLETLATYSLYTFGYFSFFMLIAIAATRHVRLTRLRALNEIVGQWKATFVVSVSFVLSNIFAAIITFVNAFETQVVLNIFDVVAIASVYVMYVLALRSVQNRRDETSHGKSTNSYLTRKEKTLAKIVKLLLLLMAICYGPYNVFTIFYAHAVLVKKEEPTEFIKVATLWSFLLVASLSFLNAILFAYGNSKVKRFVKGYLPRPHSNSVDSQHQQPTHENTTQND